MYRSTLKLVVVAALLIVAGPSSWAQQPDPRGVFNTPVYDPASKSYFELVDGRVSNKYAAGYDQLGYTEGPDWGEAWRFARERIFKGVRGRLAIVKSPQTHEFLATTFRPRNETWIGLRYWCNTRQLQWEDGEPWVRNSFSAWDRVWMQDNAACKRPDDPVHNYMSVAYTAVPEFRWIAKGAAKRYYFYFVEYPTGHP